jgi:uncharacterized protein
MGGEGERDERLEMEPIPIAIFARAPSPGRTKTRLIPALGEEGAARLSRAMLEDTLRRIASVATFAPEIWAASATDAASLGDFGLEVHVQPEGDLGARISAALAHGIARRGRAFVIGSDAPTLGVRALERAIAIAAACAIGPSADGGFWILGARERAPRLEGVRWSSRHTFDDALRALPDAGIAPPWYDVDTPADLRLLRAHLALRPGCAPATARALGIAF